MIRKIRYGVKKLSEAIALFSAELILVFILFFMSLSLVIIVIRMIFFHKEFTMDEKVFNFLSAYVTDSNTAAMQFFSFMGSHSFLVPAWLLMLTFYFFIRRNKWYFLKMLIISLSNLGLMFALKFFFNRPRPLIPLLKEVPGLSFPSGHAFMSFTFFGMMIYIVYREVKNIWVRWITIFVLVFTVFNVGLSRVYLRVHFVSDVIAGFCFGVLSLVILISLLRQIEKYNAKKVAPDLNVTKTEEEPAKKAG